MKQASKLNNLVQHGVSDNGFPCSSTIGCQLFGGNDTICYDGQCYCVYGAEIVNGICKQKTCSNDADCTATIVASKCSNGKCVCAGTDNGNVCIVWNYKRIAIIGGVAGGVILILIAFCVYCCCCRGRRR